MSRRLDGKVVVITGGSSGLGRAAALQFAAQGCTVFVAARRAPALRETVRIAGSRCHGVITDVTRQGDVARLVKTVVNRCGRIDVWVNNAGIALFARLEEAPFELHRRVIETNLYGPIHAARAVLPVFRRQQYGILINVGSLLSRVGQPFVPSYVISKFALRGLSEALRTDLADEPDIHVCSLLPYTIDTPHFQSGANHLRRRAYPMPPVQSAESVARALVDMAERPRHERYVPRYAELAVLLSYLLPQFTEVLILRAVRTWHLAGFEATSSGNLYSGSSEEPAVHGNRRPRIGTLSLAVWMARETLRIVAGRFTDVPARRPSRVKPLRDRGRAGRSAAAARGATPLAAVRKR